MLQYSPMMKVGLLYLMVLCGTVGKVDLNGNYNSENSEKQHLHLWLTRRLCSFPIDMELATVIHVFITFILNYSSGCLPAPHSQNAIGQRAHQDWRKASLFHYITQ